MATIRWFEDILAWRKARELSSKIYSLTRWGGLSKDFALGDQLRRATLSITSKLAEGFERGGNREPIQFTAHARESCGEVRSHLHLVHDAGHSPMSRGRHFTINAAESPN